MVGDRSATPIYRTGEVGKASAAWDEASTYQLVGYGHPG
jgi:hypothetical protein